MEKILIIMLLTAISLISCDEHSKNNTSDKQIIQSEFSELIATGPYPNYYYNLANELNNAGRTELAIEEILTITDWNNFYLKSGYMK